MIPRTSGMPMTDQYELSPAVYALFCEEELGMIEGDDALLARARELGLLEFADGAGPNEITVLRDHWNTAIEHEMREVAASGLIPDELFADKDDALRRHMSVQGIYIRSLEQVDPDEASGIVRRMKSDDA